MYRVGRLPSPYLAAADPDPSNAHRPSKNRVQTQPHNPLTR